MTELYCHRVTKCCKKKKRSSSRSNRACRECNKWLCRDCQVIIINPEILYWESVALNYNPHDDAIPVSCFTSLAGEKYDYDDYVAFCPKCCLKDRPLSLILKDGERKAEQCL